MVPKLHKKGSSFKGAAKYLLHDKGRAESSARVVWTDTHNIAIHDPDMAWRIMAATAMDQDRLKELAGIKATGRKSDTPVLHLTLAWHPEEKNRLSNEEMKRAASGAIGAIGAKDHQALIIAHNDETHPHIHILINRVNPEDGRMLSSSREKLNLSRWAEEYEKDRGKIYCEERVINNEARDRGEYTRWNKDQHRRLYEEIAAGMTLANDNRDAVERIRQQQKVIDAQLCEKGRRLNDTHRAQWQALYDEHEARNRQTAERARQVSARMAAKLRQAYQPAWDELKRRHENERQMFDAREEKLAGKLHNTIDALRVSSKDKGAADTARIGDLFRLIASEGERRRALMQKQAADRRALHQDQRVKAELVKSRIKEVARMQRARHSAEFLAQRRNLIRAQERDRQALKQEWRDRHTQRRRDWHDMARKTGPKEQLKSDFTSAAEGLEARKAQVKARIADRLRNGADKDKSRDGR